jgi:hypothetical protein
LWFTPTRTANSESPRRSFLLPSLPQLRPK